MEGNTNSINECLAQVVNLTKKNIAILRAINESFYTKRSHLAVIVDDETYVVPSFISLESRIESLEQNLQNICDAPLTGEAFVQFDGTTQHIQLSGYSTTPNRVDLDAVNSFNVETNNVFKDFMTPNPYIKVDLQSIPNNIKHVVVRKVAIHNLATGLSDAISAVSLGGTVDFADVERILYGHEEGIDYTVYDTVRRLPIRRGAAQGEFEIIEIIDNYVDKGFDEYYELSLDRDLIYYINNGTIQRDLQVGDTLVTWNDKVMLEIVDLNAIKRTIKVKVLQGAYADLQDKTSGNPSLYKLKYFKNASDMDATKYINVPLEEDQYVVIFISPINDTTNTQAPWGKGLFIDTQSLMMPDPEDPTKEITFYSYYNTYVNNVGDALAGITSMMDDDQQVSRLRLSEFELLKDIKPVINKDLIKVTQINKHLNDTKSIKTIRNLYDQKMQYKMELDTVQRSIDQINKALSELSFDDTTNSRTIYETQLSEYNLKKNELVDSITHVMQEIAMNANNSETPIENAKYRIRGFIPFDLQIINPDVPEYVEVIKMDVEYRYKNKSSFTGNAETFETNGESYIFSDWNKMGTMYRKRIPEYKNNHYVYHWEESNTDTNNPSFNQIDIPITQGEIVDIRVRFIYNLGHPFAEVRSDWSVIYTQEFPAEYTKNVEILDIISENNDEIKTRHFESILDERGVTEHVGDELQDQTIRYRHKAEHITSGFLTEERRVIPLDAKLHNFDEDIENLKSEVFGAASTNLIVTLSDSNNAIQLKPNIFNNFHTMSFKESIQNGSVVNFGTEDNPLMAAIVQLNIGLYNNGSYDMKLHSLFPGAYGQSLNPEDTSLFPISEYATDTEKVFMMIDEQVDNDFFVDQSYNQFMYFRRNLTDVAGVPSMYRDGGLNDMIVYSDEIINGVPQNKLLGNGLNIVESLKDTDMQNLATLMNDATPGARFGFMYPYPGDISGVSSETGDTFIVLSPGESINIPVEFVYWFKEGTDDLFTKASLMRAMTITRMMAFDIRTSLFQDPITFKFVVDVAFNDVVGFKLRKGTTRGINISKLPRLEPTTPVTVARNVTDALRKSTLISNIQGRFKKR